MTIKEEVLKEWYEKHQPNLRFVDGWDKSDYDHYFKEIIDLTIKKCQEQNLSLEKKRSRKNERYIKTLEYKIKALQKYCREDEEQQDKQIKELKKEIPIEEKDILKLVDKIFKEKK